MQIYKTIARNKNWDTEFILMRNYKKHDTLILVSSHDLKQLIKIAGALPVIENGTAFTRSEHLTDIQREVEKLTEDKVKSLHL